MSKQMALIITLILVNILILNFFCNNSFAVTQTISSDINSIDSNKYPQIKELLQELKSEHPNWNFKILYTDLDWNEVISNEYTGHGSSPRNMVPVSGYSDEWSCSICGDKTYDSGKWRCASQSAISYMMDPRNFLNTSDIFQFMELTYSDCNLDTIKAMVKNTFLDNESYINAIVTASQKYNANAYYIVARILQEQGSSGSTLSKGQGYNGQYVGYYNLFNIGASGNGTENIILNGLSKAQTEGWDTVEKSIDGGVQFVVSNYIARGQNTIYLQKFDVESSNSGLYWHQYQQNLMAAQSEGSKLKSTFEKYNSLEKEYTFVIPVYKNMPSTACAKPDSQQETSTTNSSYGDLVKCNADPSLIIRDTPNGKSTGEYIYLGEIVTRVEKATEKVDGRYWDLIVKSDGVKGYVARETADSESTYKLYLVPVEDNTENLIEDNDKIKVDDSSKQITSIPNITITELNTLMGEVSVKNSKGEVVPETSKLATGYVINDKYNVSVLGDINGDGEVDARDSLRILKYAVGTYELNGEFFKAADLNKDGEVDARDSLRILKYSVNTFKIEL